MSDLPYFDLLLEGRRRGDPAAKVFERYVHWGYWEKPAGATLDLAEFASAMERLNTEVVGAADLRDGQAVLDAGCGFGGTLASIRTAFRAAALTGLNIDERQLTIARSQVPGVNFVAGDACRMPFGDASFDRVLAVECIFHFPSRLRFLKEAARVLRSGGRVALSDFVPSHPSRGRGFLGRLVETEIRRGYGDLGGDWGDGDYAAMASAAGFKMILDRDVTAHTLPTYPVLLELLRTGASRDEGAVRMVRPTRLLSWVSRLRFVRYRIVGFEKL